MKLESSAKCPVVHVGFPKTGTTTLQESLFSQHEDIRAFGVFDGRAVTGDLLEALNRRRPEEFDALAAREQWRRLLEEAPSSAAQTVLSYEGLSVIWHPERWTCDHLTLAGRLREVLGSYRVLFVLRDQRDLVGSMYAAGYWVFGGRSFSTFLQQELDKGDTGLLSIGYFGRAVNAYANVLGAQNVRVMLFEDLRRDPDAFARELCAWLGIDGDRGSALMRGAHRNRRKARLDQVHIDLSRRYGFLSALYRSAAHAIPATVKRTLRRRLSRGALARPIDTRFPEEFEEAFRCLYGPENAQVAARMNVDLASAGYVLAE